MHLGVALCKINHCVTKHTKNEKSSGSSVMKCPFQEIPGCWAIVSGINVRYLLFFCDFVISSSLISMFS